MTFYSKDKVRKMQERKASNIMAMPVDTDKIVEDYSLSWTSIPGFHIYNKFYIREKIAIIKTERGIFVVTREGIALTKPITDENPLSLNLYGDNGNGKLNALMFPISTINLNPDDLEKYASDEIPLEEFIRSFGARLESNYGMAVEYLKTQGA